MKFTEAMLKGWETLDRLTVAGKWYKYDHEGEPIAACAMGAAHYGALGHAMENTISTPFPQLNEDVPTSILNRLPEDQQWGVSSYAGYVATLNDFMELSVDELVAELEAVGL